MPLLKGFKNADDKLVKRLAYILTKLNNSEKFTLKELALEFDLTIKTISRDLNERFIYIPMSHLQIQSSQGS